jgi:hypothetical protein
MTLRNQSFQEQIAQQLTGRNRAESDIAVAEAITEHWPNFRDTLEDEVIPPLRPLAGNLRASIRQVSYGNLTPEVARMKRIQMPVNWRLRVFEVDLHIFRLRMTVARLKLRIFWRYLKKEVPERTVRALFATLETIDRRIKLTVWKVNSWWLALRSATLHTIAMLRSGIEDSIEIANLAFSQLKIWWRDFRYKYHR